MNELRFQILHDCVDMVRQGEYPPNVVTSLLEALAHLIVIFADESGDERLCKAIETELLARIKDLRPHKNDIVESLRQQDSGMTAEEFLRYHFNPQKQNG